MTDPIIQDQNQNVQNGQNPQTVQTTTPELDFDLNLPTNEEIPWAEEPVVSLNFSDLGATETVPTETQEPKVEETAITEENQPKAEDLQQNIINSIDNISLNQTTEAQPEIVETKPEAVEAQSEAVEAQPEISEIKPEPVATQPEIIEIQPETIEAQPETVETQPEVAEIQHETSSNPIDEIATQLPPAPVEEVLQQPETKDNRLEQEDALVAEEKQATEETPVITTKEIPEIKAETLNVFEETSTPEEEKPAPGQPEQNFPPSANLQQDQMIIQQLQASAGKQSEPIATQPVAPAPTEVNLDDLLNSPVPQQAANIQPQPNNTPTNSTPAPSPLPAFTGIQGFSLPPIAAQLAQQTKQPLNKKILINFGIGIIALVVGGFMFKTMYPLEYQKLMGSSWDTTIENSLATTSWNTEEISENNLESDGLFENPALANYHSAAGENSWATEGNFNAFEDIETTMATDMTATKEQLQNYIDQGKKYIVIGKKTNDKNSTKYGLFLYKKASALLIDIENGTEISTDELNTQLADFETYLQKLTGSGSHDEIILQQPTTPTPEEFFWSENSWATEQEVEPTPTEIPTATESGTMTEETETPTENLSWDENSIIQPNELNW